MQRIFIFSQFLQVSFRYGSSGFSAQVLPGNKGSGSLDSHLETQHFQAHSGHLKNKILMAVPLKIGPFVGCC